MGKDNLKVSFRFSVREVEYRVTRTWRKRAATPDYKVVLEKLQNTNWEKLETREKAVTKRVEEILGMDFETFSRVILLPQGKFDEFIKGSKTKRREILRELAGFEIFEKMRLQANQQAGILSSEYEVLQRQQAELQLPSEAEFTEKEKELTHLQTLLPILQTEISQAQKALDEAEELLKNITRLASLQNEFDKLLARNNEIENFQKKLAQAKLANQIQGQYALLTSAKERYEKAQSEFLSRQQSLQQAQLEFNKQKEKLDEVKAEQQKIEPEIKAKESALNAAENYEKQRTQKIDELELARKNKLQREKNLNVAVKNLKEAEKKFKQVNTQAQEAEKSLQEYSPGGTRLEQLQRVSPILVKLEVLQPENLKRQQKLQATTQEKEKAEKNYQDTLTKLEQSRLTFQQQEQLLAEAEAANQKVIQKNHAVALREILHDGDNCPVCNNTYQEADLEYLPDVSLVDTTQLKQKKLDAQAKQRTAEQAANKAESQLNNLKQKELEENQELQANESQLSELKTEVSAIIQTNSWSIDALKQELKQLDESDKKYNQALAQQKETAALVREAKQALDSANNSHNTALSESEFAVGECNRWQEQLQEIENKLNDITQGKSYASLKAELQQENLALEQKIEQVNNAYKASENKFIQADAAHQQANTLQLEARSQQEQYQRDWDVALLSADFTESSFIEARVEGKKQEQWQKAIDNYRDAKIQLETRLSEVKNTIGASTTDEVAINSLRNRKQESVQKHQQADEQRTSLAVWIQNFQSKREQAEKLAADLLFVKEKAETYSTLARNLKSDEFQAYILERLERELVACATNVLQELTDSRYCLKIEDGDYYVEDNWNGGESRRVQTLSGGETFATSLSMALALSEKLSMGAELGSLFLDEGFGTLDAETLETVYQILESLRQQDKLIGVITHVKALGERLPQVKVRKAPGGSEIEVEAF